MDSKDTSIALFARLILWFVAANALVGAGSLILFPTRTDTLFFWEIRPPINAALFGALYLGGALTVGWVSYHGKWEPARFLVPILVAAGLFITLTTLLHLDRFAPGIQRVYWLVVYIGAPLLALLIYVYQERRGANWTVREPVLPTTRRIAVATGVVVCVFGLGLLIAPQLIIDYWPWNTSPLMIRIFASWFMAFGVGLLWFLVERDWSRLRLITYLMIAASGLDLLMIFLYRADWKSDGLNVWIYCLHLLAFGLIGVWMLWLQRKTVSAIHDPAIST